MEKNTFISECNISNIVHLSEFWLLSQPLWGEKLCFVQWIQLEFDAFVTFVAVPR